MHCVHGVKHLEGSSRKLFDIFEAPSITVALILPHSAIYRHSSEIII